MLRKLGVWGAAVALALAPALAQAAIKGDPKAGQMKAAMCEGCHGPGGNSPVADFPRLAGQYEDYIAKQIHDFQKGLRNNNPTMAGMAATVASMQDAHDIGAYFQQQKMAKEPIAPVDQKKAAVGKRIYYEGIPEKDVYACVNCHGERGKGKAPHISVFPVIGGQHRDYIIKQLKDFREGTRANDPAGMMADVARKLSDAEMEAVAHYLSSLLP